MTIWNGQLPPQLIVDETGVMVGGKALGFMQAIGPKTWQVLYIEPCFQPDGLTTQRFFEHEAYGEWPEKLLVSPLAIRGNRKIDRGG